MELTDVTVLRGRSVTGRIAMPPMVLFPSESMKNDTKEKARMHSGIAHESAAAYYERRAAGCGIVIVEATAVCSDGKLDPCQMGIWSDAQIPALAHIARAIKRQGAIALIQIHHAGPKSETGEPCAPVEQCGGQSAHAMSLEECEAVRDAFIEAALRAERAGFDGVELHGAHGYLLNWFLSREDNTRVDRYAEPDALCREIVEGIRAKSTTDMIVSIRLGVSCPSSADDIDTAKALQGDGFDMLNISSGTKAQEDCPTDFAFSALAYRAACIKPHVGIPVMAVGGLDAPNMAAQAVREGICDYVCVGKGQLANPFFAVHTLLGRECAHCLRCPHCGWNLFDCRCPMSMGGGGNI